MKHLQNILFLIFLSVNVYGQDIDSLKNCVKKSAHYEKGKILFDIGNYYLKQNLYDSCIFYSEKAVGFLDNDLKLSNAYENIGMAYYFKSNFSDALENFKKSLEYAKNTDNDNITAGRYSDLGVVYDYLGAYDKAVEYYIKSSKIFEKNKNFYGLSKIFNNLGIINETMEKNDAASAYYDKALKLKIKINAKPQELASTYVNIGSVSEKKGQLQTALNYYRKALDIFEKYDNKNYAALCLNNISHIYLKEKKYLKAENNIRKAVNLNKKSFESITLAKSYLILSEILLSVNKTDSAKIYLKKASNIADNQNTTELKKQTAKTEIQLYEQKKDFKTAFEIQKKYIRLSDSLYEKNMNEKAEKMQIVYETDKKEQQIKRLTSDIKQKRILWIISVFLFMLIILIVYLFFKNKLDKSKIKNYIFKQKLLRSQMNPHFIFNALNSVQAYLLDNNPQDAAMYLSAFAKLSRSILDNSRKEFVSISEETETVNNYLKIQKLRYNDIFDYRINIDENLDTDFFVIPPMLTQPFIENALIHAFKDIDYTGIIEINFEKTDNKLKISVKDNGIGYKENTKKEHRSQATRITTERLKILKKQTKTEIKFEIINRTESGKNGTKVIFILPLINEKNAQNI